MSSLSFSSGLVRGVHARERRSRKTRETSRAISHARGPLRVSHFARRTEKRETARSLLFFFRAISHARGQLRVSRFARRTTEKRETARSLLFFFCAISHARGPLRVSRFARRTTEKRETARSLYLRSLLTYHP